MQALTDAVSSLADELQVPGVAVGLLHDGEEHYAFHGVTSVENPLPVDERTLFLCGSTTKTFTATALMLLVGDGLLSLEDPVCKHLPDFRVEDESASSSVTVLQLLNHTAGWDGDFFKATGDGDDALARYVEAMAGLRQLSPPGAFVSYNNASFAVAARLVETLTEQPYETAVRTLLLEPLHLDDTLFFSRELMTRRCAIGHQRLQDGGLAVQPYGLPRADNGVGGLATTTRDLIAWARFHLEDERPVLRRMREPTVAAPGWSSGDAVGLSWLLDDDVGGVRVAGHGGAMPGQLSLFKLAPDRGFALAACTNCHPTGSAFNEQLMRWAWETVLGAPIPEPETVARSPEAVQEFCGTYETVANIIKVEQNGDGISLETIDRPEILAELGLDTEQEPPVLFLFRAGEGDRIICPSGSYRGSRGFFVRDSRGEVTALNAFGRYAPRTA
jgi:CubicO group peptidase (beta-lactamase class C family)